MNLHLNRNLSSRSLLFPLVSLICHGVFFFFFAGLNVSPPQAEIKEDEIVAMLDLTEPFPPVKIPKAPEPEEKQTLVAPVPPPVPGQNTGLLPESRPSTPGPVLDPELSEELAETPPEPRLPAAETAARVAVSVPAPVVAEASRPVPESEGEASMPVPPVGESAATSGLESPPAPAASVDSSLPSAQEIAKPSELQDEAKPTEEKQQWAALKKREEEKSPGEPGKPSHEKIEKSGLLGLLGKGSMKRPERNPLLSKPLNRLEKGIEETPEASSDSEEAEATGAMQDVARLKNSLLSSEKTRLMTQQSVSRPRKSDLKMVQGSGRNFGVISSAIAEEEWRLTSVYNKLLQAYPGLQGNLIIEFTISPAGQVIKSHVLTSSFSNPVFEKALIQAIRLWKFPAAEEGETTILYPLAFSPAG